VVRLILAAVVVVREKPVILTQLDTAAMELIHIRLGYRRQAWALAVTSLAVELVDVTTQLLEMSAEMAAAEMAELVPMAFKMD
jgi:hypothetical protein